MSLPAVCGRFELCLLADRSSIEIFANHGLFSGTVCCLRGSRALVIRGPQGLHVRNLHRLMSDWPPNRL